MPIMADIFAQPAARQFLLTLVKKLKFTLVPFMRQINSPPHTKSGANGAKHGYQRLRTQRHMGVSDIRTDQH
jgi:hypothetical protein